MSRDHHNLVAHTVQGHRGADAQTKRRARCKVGHAIDAYANGGRTWAYSHRWVDGPVGKRRTDGLHSIPGDRCLNCGKTLAQIMVKIKPPPPSPGSAAHLERALRSTR